MNRYKIRRIHEAEYGLIRQLDRDAFACNERGSDGDFHEAFADNIRRSPYHIPELDLVAVTEDGFTYLGHAIFSALPMGDGGERIVWLNSLAVRHGERDDHASQSYEYQRKGIGTAMVARGLEIAKSLGYTGCMTCGNPKVYKKMGFVDCRELGIGRDDSVDDPEGCVFAVELVPGGFEGTSKLLSYAYYDFSKSEQLRIEPETLTRVLTAMLGENIPRATWQAEQLRGGTLGDVRLVTGTAEAADGREIAYRVVLKIQKKWERPGDPSSWRREYDLYTSALGAAFSSSLRWPACYHAQRTEDEIQIWMEYAQGVSGNDLTIEMLERAAMEWGRFQGKLYRQPGCVEDIACLGDTGFMEREYSQWKPDTVEYRYLRSDECALPRHLRRMLIDAQQRSKAIFADIRQLPVVLCHRDFWIENLIVSDGQIRLIDWDCAGWGYLGEDIASLIADDTDVDRLDEYYLLLVPAYRAGLSEFIDVSQMGDFHIREMMILKFGYRMLQGYMFSQSAGEKEQQVKALQKIYEMG